VTPALLLAAAACTFSHDTLVRGHTLLKPLPQGFVNLFNLEEQLKLGYVPEVLEFFRNASARRSLDSTRGSRILGQALLESGQFSAALPYLERAHAEEGRIASRAESAWMLSQSHYLLGDFTSSARWGRIAHSEGHGVPEGWILFLDSLGPRRPYGGVPPGSPLVATARFGRPDLLRIPVRVNAGSSDDFVLDSGASLSLLTETAAKRFQVERVPDAVAAAYGLHRVELRMTFAWAKTLQIGGLVLQDVPFGILPDDALAFQTQHTGEFHFDGVLGAHLMKEFDWQLDYRTKRIRAIRLDPVAPRGGKGQNVFFRRLKPMVRASFNQEPWFLFLLDTGSEPTMVTRGGLRRSNTRELEGNYPMTIEGIGKSRVSWAKLSNASVGVERYMVLFKDIVVREESEGIEDGVLGSSFLANFDAELRFSAMTLKLERPQERYLREKEAIDAAAPR